MYDGVRRLSVLLIVGSVALLVTFWVRGERHAYDLFDLLRGEKAAFPTPDPVFETPPLPIPEEPPPPDQISQEPQALIQSQEVSFLARVSEERANLAAKVLESVVSVSGKRSMSTPERRYRRNNSGGYLVPEQKAIARQGSGVIVRKEGIVLTNYHVVEGLDNMVVTTRSREQYPASLIDFDPVVDIAVIKIDVEPDQQFPPLSLGDSSKIRDGEMVFSVGSPFGLDGTITDGVISSARPRRSSDSGPPLIQTNTVLNQGNSGGPLVNVYGKIIGINRAIYNGPSNESDQSQSYGLAIPVNAVRAAMNDILNRAVPAYGYLGVYVADVAPVDAYALLLPDTKGCVVTGALAGSPAHRAGLQKNDVILAYDGCEVLVAQDLLNLIQATPIGKTVDLKVWRDKTAELITATIQDQGSVAVPEPLETEVQRVWEIAGLEVKYLTSNVRRRRGYEPSFPMVEISDVRTDSPASLRLRPGYLIHNVDGEAVDTHATFYRLLASTSKTSVTLDVSAPRPDGSRGLMVSLQLELDRL